MLMKFLADAKCTGSIRSRRSHHALNKGVHAYHKNEVSSEHRHGSVVSVCLVSRGEVGTKHRFVAAGGGTMQLCMSPPNPCRTSSSYRDMARTRRLSDP
jgi:hypothetical protein